MSSSSARIIVGTLMFALLGILAAGFAPTVFAETFIVKDGKPNAEIVIAPEPPRTVQVAAWELRNHLRKISGATLPIVHQPGAAAVKIYVGSSEHTKRLGVTNEGLDAGAYRVVSGDDWLCLIGIDTDFEPVEPYSRSRNQPGWEEIVKEWDKIASGKWYPPGGNIWTGLFHNIDRYFLDDPLKEPLDLWTYDERGSYNAVCGFLRELGVRWYMPGELGEIIPKLDSIPLPNVDERAEPAFAVRDSSIRFGKHDPRVRIWAMRQGMRQPYGVVGAHGLNRVTAREEVKEAHPEYFLLAGGKRHGKKQCLSNPELFQSTVAYARTVADHYRYKVISLMPADGYTTLCQCPLCAGKDSPDGPYRGRLSNLVWGFTARVGEELVKTHPDAKVSNVAYNVYYLPPTNIDKLPDSVLVGIKCARWPLGRDPQRRDEIRQVNEAWLEKTDQKLLNFDSGRGGWLPAFTAHANARSLNAIKGDFIGERLWLLTRFNGSMQDAAFYSYLAYVTFRMYWGDENQDVDPILEEFYDLFYGPAREQMKAFYEYCEAHYHEMKTDKAKADRALELFAEARGQVEKGSIYDKRLALMGEFLEKLALRSEQIAREQKRDNVPLLRMWRGAQSVTVDGDLDESFWREVPFFATGRLRELQTGRVPAFGTTFKVAWGRDAVYFAIRCEDLPGREVKVGIGADRDDDPAIWDGDVVEILLETEKNSYYQIAISPTGAVVDLDRAGGKKLFRWDSQTEVATKMNVAEDYWTIEARVPVIESTDDPFHQVVGARPIESLPWYFNICRKRVGDHGIEVSAFSPTGEMGFHVPSKFAKFHCK